MLPPHTRGGDVGWAPGSGGGIPITPRNGRKDDLAPRLVMPDGGIRVELPDQRRSLPVCDSQPLVQRCRPSTRVGDAPGADAQLIDPDDERSTRVRPAHGDGPDQRMACVELAVARLETISGPGHVVRRPDPPAGVWRRERDRVAGVDRQHRLEVSREVAVQRAALEWDLVQSHLRREQAPYGVDDAFDGRHVRVLDLPVRVRHVVARDP